MARAEHGLGPAKASVLLFMQDQPAGRSYVAALEKTALRVEWVRTTSALRSRLDRADLPRPTLVMMLASRRRSMRPSELARVVLQLTAEVRAGLGPRTTTSALVDALGDYCSMRALSVRQRQVLELYLVGNNDKEIASSFNRSATTVYEHWRRMAKKASGVHKSDVINDFHRFLATRSETVNPRLLESPDLPSPRSEP